MNFHEYQAKELFAEVFENSLDAVGSRDHVAEALFALTMTGIDLSRIGEEFVLWTTEEFGFARLDGRPVGMTRECHCAAGRPRGRRCGPRGR